ncbi:NAD-dependent succinate-semialdehyde dehydrogenase [Serratia bockelmannii]|uniref:NAD-dependent succinate-semialdehyde dehydrogenase n=1 Tax=Serratia TaxID=613 RepID=UPI000B6030FE|nr:MULTISPECIES: NAD-dependent succinate-semialdehyde dehydrogenase [Serratia]ASL83068.1 NAD-dependent succinate-semialdehyde dehydrogenase [Serratia marcescens]ASM21634.1 NAD-dependent succinate-semialdehyde dehydrogenase [Serratia marcescens]ASM26406.1 NAD-dependent succinate-semialdehyde dehydrogenase [Serratia marcescens]EIV2911042.1 NAD-dependent succinate-semialdehyde dehydrogenase [Serratia marcescens]MBH2714940.1 NAD-dependent succinate-semialdehyde dehydrogenase [Serratia marcescens]
MYPDTQLYIDGQWRSALAGKTLPVTNPATDEVIGQVAHAAAEDLDLALAATERGFNVWRDTAAHQRANLMRKAAALLRERANAIAAVMTQEQGKPVAQAKVEILNAADVIDWFAGEATRTYGQIIPSRARDVQQQTLKLPVGPVAAFTPWNFPINQIVRKLSAALAAGCSIIVKGPEETPASPAELIKAFADAGIPAGVIALVYGTPAEISEYLIPHPTIRKISFTGSTRVGKHLAALAGQHMKKATMELGGHAPVLIFDDADLDAAAKELAQSKFRNAGQVCIAPTRFLIQQGVYEAFVEKFTAAVRELKLGNGLEDGVTMGPMVLGRSVDNIEALVQDAVAHGAKASTGGKRVAGKGNFFEPTVLRDVPLSARAMSEEPFGPVALLRPFATYDEAIAEANRLPYGLAAYAYSRNIATVNALGRDVESGMLSINHIGFGLPETPFGGVKDSGHGTEGGSEAIKSYLETRFVTVAGR